jgi:hypothetical protein
MSQQFDHVVMTVSGTPGTGNITHGAAAPGNFRALAATVDGVATNGLSFDLELYDPSIPARSLELNCVYNSGTSTFTRGTVVYGSRLSLTSAAIISVTHHAGLGNKLEGIAPGATANSPDAALISRANHTGTQPASTISDFVGSVLFSNLNSVETPITDSPITASDTVLTGFRKLIQRFTDYRTIARTWTAPQRPTYTDVAYASTITLNLGTGQDFEIGALTGNPTLANPTGTLVRGQRGQIVWKQDGSTTARSISLGDQWRNMGGGAITVSSAANSVTRWWYEVYSTSPVRIHISGSGSFAP